jgi:hypothetical protein
VTRQFFHLMRILRAKTAPAVREQQHRAFAYGELADSVGTVRR